MSDQEMPEWLEKRFEVCKKNFREEWAEYWAYEDYNEKSFEMGFEACFEALNPKLDDLRVSYSCKIVERDEKIERLEKQLELCKRQRDDNANMIDFRDNGKTRTEFAREDNEELEQIKE